MSRPGPGPPLFFVFCFLPPTHDFQRPGPSTYREIKNARPKNFCFLKMDDGKDDVFCHKSSVEGDEPREGEAVQFKIKHILKQGKPKERADEVKRAPAATVMVATHTETDEDDRVGLAF